jgi:hypothetical protein
MCINILLMDSFVVLYNSLNGVYFDRGLDVKGEFSPYGSNFEPSIYYSSRYG